MKNENYINIQGWMINDLKLSGNNLIIYAIIYGFSQDGQSSFTGSISYLTKATNTSKPTVIKCLKYLVENGLISKEEVTHNGVQFNKYSHLKGGGKETLQGVKKLDRGSKETLQGGSKETLPNNTILDNTIKTIDIRRNEFYAELKNYTGIYPKDMLRDFFDYWTEHGTNDKKMRFEKEKTFGITRRLSTWHKNLNKFNPSQPKRMLL